MDAAAKKALQEAVTRSAYDPAFFLRFFFKHWFPSPLPPFHLGIVALFTRKVDWLNDPIYADALPFLLEHFKYAADPSLPEGHPDRVELPVFEISESTGKLRMICDDHNNVIVPRGFSKTTLMNGINCYDCVTDGKTFCVYISKSADHAEMQLQNIKIELETNELLRAAYGDLVPNRADPEKWQADQIQLTNGAILVARGKGGQVRGLNYRARRPNKITLDDVEDDGLVASPTERTKTENWFYSAVEKAGVEMEGAEGEEFAQQPLQINNLGTLLGSECLMMTLAKDPAFNTIRFGAKLKYDNPDDTEMLWSYKMSHKTYLAKRERHRKVGKLAEFTRELDSAIRISDDTLFPSTFHYEIMERNRFVQMAIALDPAISDQPGRDPAAIVVAGRRDDGALFAVDEWGGLGKTPREKIDAFISMHRQYQCTHAGIESVGYQAALMFILQEEMALAGYWFVCQKIMQPPKVKKDDRILGLLSPRYMNGIMRHAKRLPGLEGNLADWPNGKKDYADALSMALKMMGETGALVIPEDEREKGEYAPLDQRLPPAFRTVSNHIVRGHPRANRMLTRYPTG
jgi:hypothetical protein